MTMVYCILRLVACGEKYEFSRLGAGCPRSGNNLLQMQMSF